MLVLPLGGLVACSDGASGGPNRDTIKQQIEGYAADARTAGRREQAVLMQDGVITDSEFRQAVVAAVECMERAGLDVSEIQRAETLEGYDLTFVASPQGQAAPDVSRISDDCETRFDLGVRSAWSIQYGGVLRKDAGAQLRVCLKTAGIDPGEASTLQEFMAASSDRPDAAWRCIAEATAAIQRERPPS